MTRRDRFDAYDTNAGKYSACKVPKWDFTSADVIQYISESEADEDDLTPPGIT